MDSISGNKNPIGSIEVPIDREYPNAKPARIPPIAIHFYGRGWPSKIENSKKRHQRVRIG
jgi:hypothetical protein